MKTDGQILYEMTHPKRIRVLRVDDVFRLAPFWVDNPEPQIPWELLTERCRQSYEDQGKGHNLVLSTRRSAWAADT